jgi:hypothetical protein
MQLYEQMKAEGVEPDVLTLNKVLHASVLGNSWEDAMRVFEELQHKVQCLNDEMYCVTYNCTVKLLACCHAVALPHYSLARTPVSPAV